MEATRTAPKLFFEKFMERALHFLGCYRIPLITTIVFGLLAHGFVFTNKFINHDEIYNLFGKGATIDSGRWGLGILDTILPNYSMPWIYGILTILLIAVSVCLIIHMLAIRNPALQALLAGTIVVFPVWVSTFSFMFTSSAYGVAFLLAVLSVFLLRQSNPLYWLFALGCSIFSVAIYQAYIAIIASLLVLCLILDLLRGEDILRMLQRGIFYVSFLALTLGLYYIAAQVILVLKDLEFNHYANTRNSFRFADLPKNILIAYRHFFFAFKTGEYALFPTPFSRLLHAFCFAAFGILLFTLLTVKKMDVPRILFILALILVFPLAVSCMYLFTLETGVHTLVLCGYAAVYIPLILIADQCISVFPEKKHIDMLRRTALNLMLLMLSAIIICNTFFANEAYLSAHLQYENTYGFYTSLLSDIRNHPEFDENTKLAVIGDWSYPDYFFRKFDLAYHLFGYQASAPNEYSMYRFVEYYLGFPIPFASDIEISQIQNSPEYLQMPVYPYYGSIQMLGDVFVIKLS